MERFKIFCSTLTLAVFSLVFSNSGYGSESTCRRGCGNSSDPDVHEAGRAFLKCLEEIDFLSSESDPYEDCSDEKEFSGEDWSLKWVVSHDIHEGFDEESDDEESEVTIADEDWRFSTERNWVEGDQEKATAFEATLADFAETRELLTQIRESINFLFDMQQKQHFENIQDYNQEIKKLGEENKKEIKAYRERVATESKIIQKFSKERARRLEIYEKKRQAINAIYFRIFDLCVRKHGSSSSLYARGFQNFEQGNFFDAVEDIWSFLELVKKDGKEDSLSSGFYFLKGLFEAEVRLYHDSIVSLNEALKRNPENREIYLERATAYFETGQFDQALSDYLFSGEKVDQHTGIPFSVDFASGLVNGIKKGIVEEFGEMAPAWAPIASVGMWALANNPLPSGKFVTAILGCVATAGVYLAADQMITELTELVTNWKQLPETQQGELTGYLIGKYGIEIFACYGVGQAMDSYHQLKKANAALTFDVMLRDSTAAAAIRARYQSVAKFKADEECIRKTFGRKPFPEKEIRKFISDKGYQLPERPLGIPENFITKFSEKGCGITYHDPANPNYNYVRLMPGKPHSPNPSQREPYIIQVKNGKNLNHKGVSLPNSEPGAHIPVEKFVYRP